MNISSMLWTRTMPASRNTASQMASSPASEPVWLAAASAPSGVRPALMARMGFAPSPLVTLRAVSTSARALRSSSR